MARLADGRGEVTGSPLWMSMWETRPRQEGGRARVRICAGSPLCLLPPPVTRRLASSLAPARVVPAGAPRGVKAASSPPPEEGLTEALIPGPVETTT